MEVMTTVPLAIWDARKFKWKPYLKGKLESLVGCPNWLYDSISQLTKSGQSKDAINIFKGKKYQYAVQVNGEEIQVFSKK